MTKEQYVKAVSLAEATIKKNKALIEKLNIYRKQKRFL